MKTKLSFLLFSILLISSISAVNFVITYDEYPTDYAVIGNEYLITLDSDLTLTSNYPDTLISLGNNQWKWTTNSQSGTRTFNIGTDSFEFNVISEVDEMLNQITNFKIFIGGDNSYIETNFDLDKTTQEMQFIEYEEYSANINFANFLNGLNGNVELNQGEFYPIVNSLDISSSTAITVVQAILIEEGHDFFVSDINADPQYYINYLIDYYYLTYEYPISVHVEKDEDYYKVSAEEGYLSIDGDLETQVQDFIKSKLEYFTPLDIVDEIFKFTDYDLSEYVDLDFDYEFAIDFNNLVLEDGIYTLSFLYTDSHGNTGTKNFNVILDITEPPEPEPDCLNSETTCEGTYYFLCQNEEWVNQGQLDGFCGYNFVCSSGQTTCDGEYYFVCVNNNWINYGQVDGYCDYEEPIPDPEPENETDETEIYIPSDPIILEYVNKISGLENGTILTINFNETLNVPIVSNTKVFGYLNITTNQETSGEIFFHVLKTKVTDSSKISLYVLENNVWIKLDTSLKSISNLYYNYKAYTSHFSIFMIAEDTYVAPKKKGSGGSSCSYNKNYDWECSEWSKCINGLQTRTCKEYNNCHSFYGKPEESKTCLVEEPDDVIVIDEPEPEKSKTIYILLGILVLSIILICLIINLVLKERKKKELK